MPEQGGADRFSSDLDEIRIVLRSILTTFKQGCPVDILLREYYETCGDRLPFRKLGYKSAEDLLRDLPDVAYFQTNREAEQVVFAVATRDTHHLAELVRRQKTASKGRKRPLSAGRSYSASRRPPVRQSNFARPANQHRSWSNDNRSHPQAEFFRKTFSSADPTRPRPAPVPQRFSPHAEASASATVPPVSANGINGQHNFSSLTEGQRIKRNLEILSSELSLGTPVYKSVPICKGKAFMCSVKVGPHSAGSIVEFPSADEAECAAAVNAVKLLTKYYETPVEHRYGSTKAKNIDGADSTGKQNGSTVPTEEENCHFEEIVENIILILDDHPNGIVSHLLAKKYADLYRKNLPSDWLSQLEDNAPEISLNKIDDFRAIVAKNIVKSPRLPPLNPFLLAPVSPSPSVTDDACESPAPAQIFTNIVGLDDKLLRKSVDSAADEVRNGENSERRLSVDSQASTVAVAVVGPRRSVVFNEEKNSILEFHRPDDERREMFEDAPPVYARVPEPLIFPDGSAYWDIHVHMVYSPAEFLFRLKDYESDFYDLRIKMDEYYKKNEADPIESVEDFGSDRHLFACESEDTWHRVIPIEILPDQRKAEVMFIDYGDCETVDFANLRQLEPEFVGFPAQAVKACLKGFEKWTYEDFDESAVDQFRKLVFDKDLSVQRCYRTGETRSEYQQETISLIVYAAAGAESVDADDETVVLVNEIIEKLIPDEKFQKLRAVGSQADVGIESQPDSQAQPIAIDAHQEDNTSSAAFFSPDINQNVTVSQTPIDSQVVEPNGNDTVYVDDAEEISAFSDFQTAFEVLVVFAADPTEFSIQPLSHVEKLTSLMKDLKDFYAPEHHGESQLANGEVKSGGFYAALVDGGWFRVFCCDDRCPNAISVFLIDYGEFYVCPSAMIRRLPSKFRYLPMLSIQCSLQGIRPFDKFAHSYDADCSLNFGEKVTGGRFLCTVYQRTVKKSYNKPALPYLDVDLIEPENGESISAWLIEKKFAAIV